MKIFKKRELLVIILMAIFVTGVSWLFLYRDRFSDPLCKDFLSLLFSSGTPTIFWGRCPDPFPEHFLSFFPVCFFVLAIGWWILKKVARR